MQFKAFQGTGWDHSKFDIANLDTDYRWCDDIEFLLDAASDGDLPIIAADTEGTGLAWYRDTTDLITLQISWEPGKAVVLPLHPTYYPIGPRKQKRLLKQTQQLMSNPKVLKIGHNLKFDNHILREADIRVKAGLAILR